MGGNVTKTKLKLTKNETRCLLPVSHSRMICSPLTVSIPKLFQPLDCKRSQRLRLMEAHLAEQGVGSSWPTTGLKAPFV